MRNKFESQNSNVPNRPFRQRIGVLLAAGRGRRMGRTKQLCLWPTANGHVPLVAAAFDTIAPLCQQMVVVLAHDAEVIQAALAPRHFLTVPGSAGEMFESLRRGLLAAQKLAPAGAVLLQLGDHPQTRPETLAAICTAAADDPGAAIVPEFRGQGGHPVLIPMSLVPDITSVALDGGLRVFWSRNPESCRRLPVRDASIIQDVDTPDELPQELV